MGDIGDQGGLDNVPPVYTHHLLTHPRLGRITETLETIVERMKIIINYSSTQEEKIKIISSAIVFEFIVGHKLVGHERARKPIIFIILVYFIVPKNCR